MINAQDIKIGTAIRMDGKLYFCIDFLHVKPGKGNTFMRTKLKDVVNGYVLERRFNIGEKLEDVRVERRPSRCLFVSLSKTERGPNEEQAKNERKSNERRSRNRRESIENST